MTSTEFHRIAECAYGVPYGRNSAVDHIIDDADKDHSHTVSHDEYLEFAKKHQQVAYPAFNVKIALQQGIGGEDFWKRLTKKREKTHGNHSLRQIMSNK